MPTPSNASTAYKNQIRSIALGATGTIDSSMAFTGTGAATAISPAVIAITVQAVSDSSHSGTTTVDIQVSNDNTHWSTIQTLSVTDDDDSDIAALEFASWGYLRGNCTAHGDSTNTVTLYISY